MCICTLTFHTVTHTACPCAVEPLHSKTPVFVFCFFCFGKTVCDCLYLLKPWRVTARPSIRITRELCSPLLVPKCCPHPHPPPKTPKCTPLLTPSPSQSLSTHLVLQDLRPLPAQRRPSYLPVLRASTCSVFIGDFFKKKKEKKSVS